MISQPMTTVMGTHGVHIFKCSRTEYLESAYIGEIRRYLSYLMKTQPRVRAVLDLAEAVQLSSEAIGLQIGRASCRERV